MNRVQFQQPIQQWQHLAVRIFYVSFRWFMTMLVMNFYIYGYLYATASCFLFIWLVSVTTGFAAWTPYYYDFGGAFGHLAELTCCDCGMEGRQDDRLLFHVFVS